MSITDLFISLLFTPTLSLSLPLSLSASHTHTNSILTNIIIDPLTLKHAQSVKG